MAENGEQKQIDEMQEFMEANGNDYIKNDELDENKYLKTFITEWTVSDGDTIVLPIYLKQDADEERGEKETYFNYDFKVDYGDGTIAEVKSFDDEAGFTLVLTDVPQIYIIKLSKQMKWGKSPIMN